jgi:hypothetical protein
VCVSTAPDLRHDLRGCFDIPAVADAIRRSWSAATSADPTRWTPDRPSIGQCDASSFVAWELLGGELVLAAVLVDGVQREHHYSNLVAGYDIDLTADQFDGVETFERLAVLSSDEIVARAGGIRPDAASRIALLRADVHRVLTGDEPSAGPLAGRRAD